MQWVKRTVLEIRLGKQGGASLCGALRIVKRRLYFSHVEGGPLESFKLGVM